MVRWKDHSKNRFSTVVEGSDVDVTWESQSHPARDTLGERRAEDRNKELPGQVGREAPRLQCSYHTDSEVTRLSFWNPREWMRPMEVSSTLGNQLINSYDRKKTHLSSTY